MRRKYFALFLLFILVTIISYSCSSQVEEEHTEQEIEKFKLVSEIKSDNNSPFYVNLNNYPSYRKNLPIGIFDSGTGGLTVLDAVIKMDRFDNRTHEQGSDGIPDFISEKFIYLGDRANMPYGRYPSEGKTDFLKELIIKDVRFLLSDKYFLNPEHKIPRGKKSPVKAVVIACNTATAYGFELIEQITERWGLDIKTLGIIESGAKEAVETTPLSEKEMIGIFATEGTCDSGGYVRALKKFCDKKNHKEIKVVQQPCFGLAGAIDGDPAYITYYPEKNREPEIYQGPGIGHPKYPIDLSLWKEYKFEHGSQLLVKKDKNKNIRKVEINSIGNYIKYYITSLVTKALKEQVDCIHSVILGCTHYALFKQEFKEHFFYLRSIDEKYKELIPKDLVIIDPAESEAANLYLHLRENNLFGKNKNQESQFFLSVPNPLLKELNFNSRGEFPIDYKYGRSINQSVFYVKRIPLTKDLLSSDLCFKLENHYPDLYRLLFGLY